MIKKFSVIFLVLIILVAAVGFSAQPASASGSFPYFFVVGVVTNKSVTITTYNFPANDSFKVLMGPYGSLGINGIKVGNYKSGNGQSKTVTYPVPAQL